MKNDTVGTNNVRREAIVFLMRICCVLASVTVPAVVSATPESNSSSAIGAAVQTVFGSTVEPVKGFKPYFLIGDFDGDGAQDALVVVRVKGARAELPKDVRFRNPFSDLPVVGPSKENRLALAIIHDWKAAQPRAKILLIGESPVLALQYERAVSGRAEDASNLLSLMKRHGPRPKDQKFPPLAKGDVILLSTEVGNDSMLYWDGKKYRWKDLEED